MTRLTLARVAAVILGLSLRTMETVATETPACRAISRMPTFLRFMGPSLPDTPSASPAGPPGIATVAGGAAGGAAAPGPWVDEAGAGGAGRWAGGAVGGRGATVIRQRLGGRET